MNYCEHIIQQSMELDDEPSAKRPRLGSKTSEADGGNDMDLDLDFLNMTSLQSALPQMEPNGGTILEQQNPHNLPVDNWAGVMRYLAFPDMLGFSASARYFLRDVSPLVRKLTITSWTQMHPRPPAKRFVGIREVSIACLLEPDEQDGDYKLCQTTSDLVVKFLSAFPNLRRAWVGGVSLRGDRIAYDPSQFEYHDQVRFATVIETVCDGYRTGHLSQDLHMEGLVDFRRGSSAMLMGGTSTYACPYTRRHCCPQCHDICKYFPVLHVIKMESGIECLSFEKRLEMLKSRPGGRDAIVHCAVEAIFDRHKHDPLWIVRVDANGKPIGPGRNNGGDSMYRVDGIHYSPAMIEEVKIAMRYGIDTSEYDYAALEEHLPVDMHGVEKWIIEGSTRGKLYITEPTYNALVELGLALNPTDFRSIVRSEETQMFSMGGLLSLERLPGSIPLLMDTEV